MEIKLKEKEELKEYYIAYMDLLGYKEFFKENPESTMEFYEQIKNAIKETKKILKSTKQPLKYKIFSDNIIIFSEVLQDKHSDVGNLLMLMVSVSSIQSRFILEHNLFLRGSITKGNMCVNKDFLFGEGLIEAVELEGKALYPRIIISDKVLQIIKNYNCLDEKALENLQLLNNRIKNKEKLEAIDTARYKYYRAILYIGAFTKMAEYFLIYECGNVSVLNYIDNVELHMNLGKENIEESVKLLNLDYNNERPKPNSNLENDLKKHKNRIEGKLRKYAGKHNVNPNLKNEELREHILKKYIWSNFYHNSICELYGLEELKINGQVQLDEISLKVQYRFDNKMYYGIQPRRNK